MLLLNVTYQVKKEMRTEFLKALADAHIAVRACGESGNLNYTFFVPVEESDSEKVFLLEQYTGEEAFEIHKSTAHFAELQEIKAKYVADTHIIKTTV